MSLELRWTEHAVNQLGAIAEYIALVSPVYAEQTIDRIVARLGKAQDFPESGRRVAERCNCQRIAIERTRFARSLI